MRDFDFIERTHAPEVRDDFNRAEAARLSDEVSWDNLHIHGAKQYGDIADVDFVVTFHREGKQVKGATTSKFRRDNGEWFYVSSKPAPHLANRRVSPKIGRNDVCSCGSGRKYKKCCGGVGLPDVGA
jgi:SEC-C motif-containing protein